MICRKVGMWEYTQISYQLREKKKEEERVSIMLSDSRNTDNIPFHVSRGSQGYISCESENTLLTTTTTTTTIITTRATTTIIIIIIIIIIITH